MNGGMGVPPVRVSVTGETPVPPSGKAFWG